ncbi:MAG TPA: barstar family protein [Segeticoccus sp.]|nr:barstar family protein [Segeticoccus sp.]
MTLEELLTADEGRVLAGADLQPAPDPAEVAAAARGAAWRFVHLDTSTAGDKATALGLAQAAFGLPEWFGRNWDALADALSDVTDDGGVLVLWSGVVPLRSADPATAAALLDVLTDRAADRDPRGGGPFCVVVT